MVDKSLFIKVRNTLLSLIAVVGTIFMIEGMVFYLIKIEFTASVLRSISESLALQALLVAIIIYSFAAIYIIKNRESTRLKKIFKQLSVFFGILLITGIFLAIAFDSYLLISIASIFTFLIVPLTLYGFYDEQMSRINLIMVIGFILSFIWKRFHLPFASIFIMFFCVTIATGMFLYFYKCLFTIENNRYLKVTSMLASLIIAFGFLSVLFKFQHWPGASLLIAAFYSPMLILTIIVLLTLPGSGFISWEKSHREVITRKLLVLWITLLIFGSLRYILPQQSFNTVFVEEIRQTSAFDMFDYEPEIKNGLSTDVNK